MSKLVNAYLWRLKRDKSFWIFSIGMLMVSIFMMIGDIKLSVKFPNDEEFSSLDSVVFDAAPFIGAFASVVISMFLGKEYSDGTIRNKLISGKTKTEIYMASLVNSVVISEFIMVAWMIGSLVGIPHFGLWKMENKEMLLYVLITIFSTASLGAIFNMTSMLIQNRTASVVTAIFLFLGILLASSGIYNRLCEPETTITGIYITANGVEYGDEIANSLYVSGTLRSILQAVLNILPAGQTILIVNHSDTTVVLNPTIGLAGSTAIIVITTLIGTVLFRKKDIK
jgi:ABC-type transport system involved in multi-copper enzyme maturation permease subunit